MGAELAAACGAAGSASSAAASGRPAASGTSRAGAEPAAACGAAPAFDAELYAALKRNTRILAADGAKSERRLLLMACKKFFGRVGMVIRDPAHAIRISTQKPLHLEQEFGAVYSELIGNRHSLISDIQNSGKWRLQLEAMERECLRIPALSREGAMKCVLRHLSMAKQRMDSAADPLAKLCLMLMPVC